jgi:hypothetical protein
MSAATSQPLLSGPSALGHIWAKRWALALGRFCPFAHLFDMTAICAHSGRPRRANK